MIRYLPLLLVLMSCNTPSPGFRGLPATRVTVEGSTFDVRVNDLRAEAIRINPQYAPRFGPIRARAAAAMAQVSGCEVKAVTGDQAIAFGRLKCGKRQAAPIPTVTDLDCIPERGSEIKGVGQVTVALDCVPA